MIHFNVPVNKYKKVLFIRYSNLIKLSPGLIDFNRYRRLAKEGGWIVVGQVASVLGSLVLVRVLTEHLNPTQFGQFSLGLTIAGLVTQVVMGGISASIGRFYSIAVEKQDFCRYLYASKKLLSYATLAVIIIGFVLIALLNLNGYSQWTELTVFTLLFSVVSGYNSSLNNIQNAARQRIIVAFHSGLNSWLKILIILSVFCWLGNTSIAVVVGYILALLITTGSQLLFIKKAVPIKHIKQANSNLWMRKMWSYSWPFSSWGVFTWAQQSSDRWALETFSTTHEVGLYSVLFQLGYTPVLMVTGLVVSFLGPILYQRSGDATDLNRNATVHHIAWRITFFSLFTTAIGFLFSLAFHSLIFKLLVSAHYHYVSNLLPWVVLAGGLFAGSQILALKLMSDMKPLAMAFVKTVTALFGVLLNICLAFMYGIKGVVCALVAFSVIYFIWMVLLTFNKPTTL